MDSFKYLECNNSSNMNCCQEISRSSNGKRRFQQEKKYFLRALGKITTEETTEVLCVECSDVWCRDSDTTTEGEKRLEAFVMWIWRRMERVK